MNGAADAKASESEAAEEQSVLRLQTCPFPSVQQRYFSHYRIRDAKGVEGNHVRIMRHSNGLVVVCADPLHALVQGLSSARRSPLLCSETDANSNARDMEIVLWSNCVPRKNAKGAFVGARTLPAAMGGRNKHHAPRIRADTIIGYAETAAGLQFRIPACCEGALLEYNERLFQDASLLQRDPLGTGFVAVLNPFERTAWTSFECLAEGTLAPVEEDGDW